ncbi:MAG: hypothetical protein ACPLTR_08150 [Thermacetogeniaceae bacterium]
MTLVEVLVALVVFGFLSAALMGLSLAGSRDAAVAHHDVAAVNVAQEILEQVKSASENQLGTAQGGANTTIQLGFEASSSDDCYNEMTIALTGGKGVGQVRKITDYDGILRTAAVDQPWDTVPDITTEYVIFKGVSSLYSYRVEIGQPHELTGELRPDGELKTVTVTVSYVAAGGCIRKVELTGERLKRW